MSKYDPLWKWINKNKPDEFLELSRLMENAQIIAAAMYEMAK